MPVKRHPAVPSSPLPLALLQFRLSSTLKLLSRPPHTCCTVAWGHAQAAHQPCLRGYASQSATSAPVAATPTADSRCHVVWMNGSVGNASSSAKQAAPSAAVATCARCAGRSEARSCARRANSACARRRGVRLRHGRAVARPRGIVGAHCSMAACMQRLAAGRIRLAQWDMKQTAWELVRALQNGDSRGPPLSMPSSHARRQGCREGWYIATAAADLDAHAVGDRDSQRLEGYHRD